MTPDLDDRLQDFLADGFHADDLPALHPLLRGRGLLRAFTGLFHGGEGNVLARLLVLRTLGARATAPAWSLPEIREHLAFIDATKLDTVLARLKEHDLLVWDADPQRYRISPLGRKALAAVATLLEFDDDPDGLGYLTAQLAAGQAMGKVSAEELGHLLSRLTELRDDFDRAVLSGSEHRIRGAASALNATWRWIEKGTAIIQGIADQADLDPAVHRLAQAVGRAQSQLLRQAGIFQRALNQIDQHRVHLGGSGLSSSDLLAWLRACPVERLLGFADDVACLPLPSRWLHDGISLDVAEFELIDRERALHATAALPAARGAAETARIEVDEEDLAPLQAWLDQLRGAHAGAELHDLLPVAAYADSAYRLSLLSLLGDRESSALDGPAAEIARLPLRLQVEPELITLDHPQIAAISRGRLHPFTER